MKKKIILVSILSVLLIGIIITIIFINTNTSTRTEDVLSVNIENQQATTTEVILEEYDISRSKNDNVKATLYEDGILVIYGTGEMADNINWGDNSINHVKIEEGITYIGYNAFYDLDTLRTVKISSTVERIKEKAFAHCDNLEKVIIPSSVHYIEENAFDESYHVDVYCKSDTTAEHFLTDNYNRGYDEAQKRQNEMMSSGEYDIAGIIEYNQYGEYFIRVGIVNEEDGSINWSYEVYRYVNGLQMITDDSAPSISSVSQNPAGWTTEEVILTINTEDTIVGLEDKAYSFDGGITWQESNTKTYTENTNDIRIQVRDNLGNIATAETINIGQIDKTVPTITSITGNPANWTSENVTLIVNANDTISGLSAQAYSFDGGTTWQESNMKTYTENTNGITIKVRDNAGNIATANTIDITKIRRLENISIHTMPNKTTYYVGDTLNTSELTITLHYSNGDSERISQGFTCNPTQLNTAGTQTITVDYQGETITFSVIVEEKPEQPTEITLTSDTYMIEASTIKNIQPKTILSNFKQNIITNATLLKIVNNTIELSNNDIIGTGMQLVLENKISYTLIVKGDSNGNGKTDLQDILAINKHRLNKVQLQDEYLTASDVNNDGKADVRDILQINKYRLDKINEL